MAIQELDLAILHRSGKRNTNADALSRSPLPDTLSGDPTCGVVAAITGRERDLATPQRADEDLAAIVNFLESGILPED